jgi:hypothetical protein
LGGTLTVENYTRIGGTLNTGAHDLHVTRSLSWIGGRHTGPGTTFLENGATATLGGLYGGLLNLEGNHNFTNNGTVTQVVGARLNALSGSNSVVTNGAGATWNVGVDENSRVLGSDGGAAISFVNLGTLNKTGSAQASFGSTQNGDVSFANNSGGLVNVQGGTLFFLNNSAAAFNTGGTTRVIYDGNNAEPPIDANSGSNGATMTVGGALEIILADGYVPSNGATDRIINYGSASSGTFMMVTPPTGRTVTTNYASDGFDITYTD